MTSTPTEPHQPAGLAPYACRPEDSRGRLHREPESATRSCFQRDRDRIIHSGAFRKLKHKTQVFVYHEGDYYRTRLTHSIEVAQIARTVSRQLGLNEDLTEALALAHDLGHTCFGHAGETALDKAMTAYGGFDHNEQTIRIVTKLEQRYAEFDGLNLTWECLEGLAKHNGPLHGPLAHHDGGPQELPPSIACLDREMDLELAGHPSLEAQVASLCELGKSAPNPVLSTIRYFREEYEAHIEGDRCPAGICPTLTRFFIDEDACDGCHACFAVCPTDAITGEANHVHTLHLDKCTSCGACFDVCPVDAVGYTGRSA